MKMIQTVRAALLLLTLLGAGMAGAQSVSADLKAASEVPANDSSASGKVNITVAADKSVSGSITTSGIDGTMAHIHLGAAGANGPVIVKFEKNGSNGWTIPAGATLTDAQYSAYQSGGLYVNVHSAAHPGGEIRGQLLPK